MNNRPVQIVAAAIVSFTLAAQCFATTFTLNIVDPPGQGFNDTTPASPVGGNPGTTLGELRINTLIRATEIWAAVLQSDVPISVAATFAPQFCSPTSAVLASASTTFIFQNFPGANETGTWYHGALADSLAGMDLLPGEDDLVVFVNSNIDADPTCIGGIGWYYGFDHEEGIGIDLLATLLHEIGHGLGFANLVNETNGVLFLGSPDIYTIHTLDLVTDKRWDDMTNTERVASAINDPSVVWDGAIATNAAATLLVTPSLTVAVNSPGSIAGSFLAGTAAFGPPVPGGGITSEVVLVDDGTDTVTDGCQTILNGSELTGKIALIDRGGCSFADKVQNAQDQGAVAVIVANNIAGNLTLGGSSASVTIPAVGVPMSVGDLLKTELPGIVNVTIGLDAGLPAGTAGGFPRLNAPNPVQSGSSISHWSPDATPNLLMEPAISSDLTDDLDLTVPLLEDLGWNQGPAFTLVTATPEMSLCAPSDVTVSVEIGAVFGYSNAVTLSFDDLPDGITGSFSPNPSTPPGDVTVTITAAGTVVTGAYSIDITGTGADADDEHLSIIVNVFTAAPTDVVMLDEPAHGDGNVALQPTFSWFATAETETYLVEVDNDSDFSSIEAAETTDGAALTLSSELDDNARYFWRVTPENICGAGPVSEVRVFTTTNIDDAFVADFSDGGGDPSLDGFTFDNSGGDIGLWHLSTGRGVDAGHSADDSLYFGTGEDAGGNGTYDVGHAAGRVTSPEIDLTAATGATLTYSHFLETEGAANIGFDVAAVRVSENGGAFTTIASNATSSLLEDPTSEFETIELNLDAFVGSTIRIQFDFDTADDEFNDFEGWYVDDVAVVTETPVCAIADIQVGAQGPCDPGSNLFTQEIIVYYSTPPATGELVVNGQAFAIDSSPQTIVLTGLSSDASTADVTAAFSAEPGCSLTIDDAFTAPAPCIPDGVTVVGLDFGGNLVITDSAAAGTDNNVTITLDPGPPAVVVIHDTNNMIALNIITGTTVSANEVRIPLTEFAGAIVINGGDGDDVVTVDFSGGDPIPAAGLRYNGEGNGGGGDALVVTGGSFTTVGYTAAGTDSGSVDYDGSVITYTGLEPITDNTDADHREFTISAFGDHDIRLIDDGTPSNGMTTIDSNGSTGFEEITFTNPNVSLTINAGAGDDFVLIDSTDSGMVGELVLNAGGGDDLIDIAAAEASQLSIFVDGGAHSDGDILHFDAQDEQVSDRFVALVGVTFNRIDYVDVEFVDISNDAGPVPVPTLSEWGVILLGLLVVVIGAAAIRRMPAAV